VDRNRYDTAFRTAVRKDFHSDDHVSSTLNFNLYVLYHHLILV